MDNNHTATSQMMAKRQQDDGYKKYLAWLSYVYPRFAKYYDILKADGNWMKPTKKVNETGKSQDVKEEYIDDRFFPPVEIYCEVNIPKAVS